MTEDGAGPDAIYRDGLAEGEIRLQRCGDCGAAIFYPRVSCPKCHSRNLAWSLASGEGTVYSTTVSRRRPESGGDFNIAIIELAEGPRLMSRVEGVKPDEVAIGMKVAARIAEQGGERFLVFDPVPAGGDGS